MKTTKTKAQLQTSLIAAHRALAYVLVTDFRKVEAARRAIRQHPHCDLFPDELNEALHAKRRHEHSVKTWLSEDDARAVRLFAAWHLRMDIALYRRLRAEKAEKTIAKATTGPVFEHGTAEITPLAAHLVRQALAAA